ncbi:UDP-3-O-(3-hydroxymyristoyl)glucosamine N-acyltransferase [Methylocapsa polymorpha]|uniref:UDP-3-O-acylglucosamine N-acyltransferase n=1 Tax=Methylocapsa polymorpha TaxID=3080828 RepID=A0ABZ0HV79_9HYPH|nr:UDP-3-O-(3-hydroxymyristoyl)glucosamine N-acyltransferase [Methylocapsa sp. RX1]
MTNPVFFWRELRPSLADIVAFTGARVAEDADLSSLIGGAAPLDEAEPGELAFVDHPRNSDLLETTRATACFVTPRDAARVPKSAVALVTDDPVRAFALALSRIFPSATRPASLFAAAGVNPGASIHPEARLEPGVIVDPGVVIGPRAEIGAGSIIAANSVIGPDVRIGRDCSIGAQVTISHALVGNRVVVLPGVRIGQAGLGLEDFGSHANWRRPPRTPQIGRVIIQDDAEIGANSTIDRGGTRDTVIGEGAYVGNLAQIACDVTIGRYCVIFAQVSVEASTKLGDFVVVDRQAALAGRLRIGAGARISAQSAVVSDVPERAHFGGSPARPLRQWLRGLATLDWLTRAKPHLRARRD